MKKWAICFDTTFKMQIEILPRITFVYGEYPRVFAIEFLWFSVCLMEV